MKNKKISMIQLLRIVIQVMSFVFLPALFISAFSGVKQIYTSILDGNFNFIALFPQIIETLAIIPITLFIGRFFCGWMCAFGALSDWIYKLAPQKIKKKIRINETTDAILKNVKYVLLIVLVIAGWSMGMDNFKSANPWDAFGMLFTVGKMPDLSYVSTYLLPALILLMGILIASFFVERFFCRYLCPLGAIFAVTSKLRMTKIVKPTGQCGNCRICTKNCPMNIPLYKSDSCKSGECIDCFQCVSVCPRKNVSFAVAESDVRPVIAGTMAVAVMTGVYYVGSFAADQTGLTSSAEVTAAGTSSTQSAGLYQDGIYEGSGTGFRGQTTTVSVTVENGLISDIQTVSTGDDGEFYNRASAEVFAAILDKQDTEVDAVSGATFSSNGIMEAVANALSGAKTSDSDAANSQENIASIDQEQKTSLSSNTVVKTATKATTTKTTKKTSTYKNGTYKGSGTGFRGTTSVTVTIKNHKIKSISVNSYEDDKRFFERAYNTVISSIINKQSTNVDAVSGATFSSNGIMEAVANALKKAK